MNIVIVEDEKALRDLLAEKFESAGFTVSTVENGDAAIAVIEKERPNIVLLDLILPHKNGFLILAQIKTSPDLRDIPVYVLSNLADDESIKKAMAMGAQEYLVKADHPVEEVLELVKKRLTAA